MALFRFHRGSLGESLRTTIIVKDLAELKNFINLAMQDMVVMVDDNALEITIEPYASQENCFDARIGWYTQIVIAKYKNITAHPVGFLSEPLD